MIPALVSDIVETELRDARGDLGHLGIGVRPRVSRVGHQAFDRPLLNLHVDVHRDFAQPKNGWQTRL